jgi:hypothetical protein
METKIPEIDTSLYPVYKVLKPLIDQEDRLTQVLTLATFLKEINQYSNNLERLLPTLSVSKENVEGLCGDLVKLKEAILNIQDQAPFCQRTLDNLGTSYDGMVQLLLSRFKEELNYLEQAVPETSTMGTGNSVEEGDHEIIINTIARYGEHFSLQASPIDKIEAAVVDVRGRTLFDAVKNSLIDAAAEPEKIVDILKKWNEDLIPQELRYIERIFPRKASQVIDKVSKTGTVMLTDSINSICLKLRNGLKNRQFSPVLVVFPILDKLLGIKQDNDKTTQLALVNFAGVGKALLAEIGNWLKYLEANPQNPAANGSITEYTLVACSVISSAIQFQEISETLLTFAPEQFMANLAKAQVGIFSLFDYVAKLKESLNAAIVASSNLLITKKSPDVQIIFLLNNNYYIFNHLNLGEVATDESKKSLELYIGNLRGRLIDNWKRCALLLESDGASAKDKYKAFNAQLSALHSVQKELCIVDEGLRNQLRVQIHEMIIDPFNRFYNAYLQLINFRNQSIFESGSRMTPQQVTQILNELFSG